MRLPAVFRILLAAAALAMTTSTALAQSGINLSWNDCGSFGTLQKNFACTSNTGSNTIFGSGITSVDLPQLNGHLSILELQTNQAALTSWWQFNTGGCHAGALTVDFDFAGAGNTNCLDPWGDATLGGAISYEPGFNGPNRARIRTAFVIAGGSQHGITVEDEYYFFKITFRNTRSVGNGSCTGCTDGACIVFNSLTLTQPAGVGDYTISTPATRNFVVWQGGSSGCFFIDAVRTPTWGNLKSLYR